MKTRPFLLNSIEYRFDSITKGFDQFKSPMDNLEIDMLLSEKMLLLVMLALTHLNYQNELFEIEFIESNYLSDTYWV